MPHAQVCVGLIEEDHPLERTPLNSKSSKPHTLAELIDDHVRVLLQEPALHLGEEEARNVHGRVAPIR